MGVEIQLFSRFLAKGLKENYANLIAEMARTSDMTRDEDEADDGMYGTFDWLLHHIVSCYVIGLCARSMTDRGSQVFVF